jgi:hypothetical protein
MLPAMGSTQFAGRGGVDPTKSGSPIGSDVQPSAAQRAPRPIGVALNQRSSGQVGAVRFASFILAPDAAPGSALRGLWEHLALFFLHVVPYEESDLENNYMCLPR